jgi:trimethylamine---corrinoid protein Co-methyltransferase
MSTDTTPSQRRDGRRAARSERPRVSDGRRRGSGFTFVDGIKPIEQKLTPFEIISAEGVEAIHRASMRLLKDTGILIIDYPQAVETFRQNGARIENGNLIKLDEETIMHFVRMAPATFTQLARNPAKNVPIGGKHMVFAPVYGPPFVADLDRGRRQGTIADFENFSRLAYMAEHLHHNGGTLCEPNDVEIKERHLDMLLAHISYSDKAFMGSVTHKENARDTVRMCEILFGAEAIRQHTATISLINASSPLRFDDRMFGALEVYARARQAVLVTPFLIAGAMSPSTMAATLAQQNAEALFGIAYAQMLNRGTPCIYGSFLANIDMKSGAPCFGTPENSLALYAGAQMARRYSLPYRSGGNFTASRIPDAQAGYESANTFQATVQGGVNFVLHAAGWLEGGLISGYEKFVLDLETCGMAARLANGISLTDEDFAWDAFAEVGPGGHFLGAQHTMRHYDTAFYQHGVFSMDNYEKWESEGSEDSYKRANKVWKQMLAEYQQPALDAGVKDELLAFVDLRRAEIRAGKLNRED